MGSAVGIVGVIGFDKCFERCIVRTQQSSDGQIEAISIIDALIASLWLR